MDLLPRDLRTYLSSHLRVVATISGPDNAIQWALFFGAKGKMPAGDNAFTGVVDNDPTLKIKWACQFPFWFIPISEAAKQEALSAKKENRLPSLKAIEISIHNEKSNRVRSWLDYDHWVSNDHKILTLGPDSALTGMSGKGRWHMLSFGVETWPVWLTTQDLSRKDRIVSFSAPTCQIVNAGGAYVSHEVWFGAGDWDIYPRPFMSINEVTPLTTDGNDTPLNWWGIGREDYLLVPAAGKKISAATWNDVYPLKAPRSSFSKTAERIDKSFGGDEDSILYAWLIKENEAPQKLRIVYLRNYFAEGRLATHIGWVPLGLRPKSNSIGILQICAGDNVRLLTRVRYFVNSRFLDLWNGVTDALAQSLKLTNSSSPVGIVPHLLRTAAQRYVYVSEWTSELSCDSNPDGNQFTVVSSILYLNGKQATYDCDSAILPLIRHHRPSLQAGVEKEIVLMTPVFASTAQSFANDNGTLFQLVLESYDLSLQDSRTHQEINEEVVVRDGALSFTLKRSSTKGKTKIKEINVPDRNDLPPIGYGRFRIVLQLAKAQRPLFLWQWFKNIDKEDDIVASYAVEDFSLPVLQVSAAGQDITAKDKLLAPRSLGSAVEGFGERAESPLIVPISSTQESPGDKIKMLLTFSESINVGQDHRLDIRLQELNPGAQHSSSSQVKAVILDAAPQIVALIDAKFLQQPGYDDGAWVLARRSRLSQEGGGWELLDDESATEGFKLMLPSQAIGEAYVKNDLGAAGDIAPGEPEQDKPIAYRFGAPAMLRLSSERLEKRYVAAPWNLRRIWGEPGDEAPGIPFLESYFELLYGLTGTLRPEKAFIAELASKLGDIPAPPVNSVAWKPTKPQQAAFENAWRHYLLLYRAWKSRLAVLEPSTADDFASALFDKNISFGARIELTQVGDDFKKTAGADLRRPFELTDGTDLTDPGDILKRKIVRAHQEAGLAGGFHYGFESEAIYKELWRELFTNGSSSGEVRQLAFSSVGGWGRQIARFAGDKTVIKSVTAMGRTHFYAVERIGRIGVWWNKAKHVIEYERTVVPSNQFDKQPPHLGRPLVRKVREYIEILEPTRAYPDFPVDAPDAPGAVKSCTFKSKIIPVLSSWGHDVWGKEKTKDGTPPTFKAATIGWEVPLWKPGADPAIYPKPQVVLSLTPSPEADEEEVISNLSEPENLWFYTDTREYVIGAGNEKVMITADVHSWPAVQDVDYTDLPEPEQYDIHPSVGDTHELMDAPLPDVNDVSPGFERFTFRVDRSEMPAAVASRYYPESAITGRLRTVSMTRSFFKKNTDWLANGSLDSQAAKKALDKLVNGTGSLLASSANGFRDIEAKLRSVAGIPAGLEQLYIEQVKKYSSSVTNELSALKGRLPVGGLIELELVHLATLKGKMSALDHYPLKWVWRESLEGAEGVIKRAMSYVSEKERILLEEFDQLLRVGNATSSEAGDVLNRFRDRLVEFHVDVQFKVDSVFSAILKGIETATNSISATVDEKFNQVVPFVDGLVPTTPDLKNKIKERIDSDGTSMTNASKRVLDVLLKIPNAEWQGIVSVIGTEIDTTIKTYQKKIKDIADDASPYEGLALINTAKNEIHNQSIVVRNKIRISLSNASVGATKLIDGQLKTFFNINGKLGELGGDVEDAIKDAVNAITSGWAKGGAIGRDEVTKMIEALKKDIEGKLKQKISAALYVAGQDNNVYGILKDLKGIFKEFEDIIKASLLDFFGSLPVDPEVEIRKWVESFDAYNRLQDAIKAAVDKEAILRESLELANKLNGEFGRLTGEVAQTVRDFDKLTDSLGHVLQAGDQTLKNFRSVWEEFTAPGMGLNRRTVAMIVKTDWKDVEQRLSITPAITRVKELGEAIDGLGVRLPVAAIKEYLLPAKESWGDMKNSLINKFDFSNVLSDLGGVRLDKLFPGFKMPPFARDKIKVTQGFDKSNLMAWANAETDVKLGERKKLMSIGPVLIELENGHFEGKMRLEAGINGGIKKTNSGKLSGSWHINIAGTGLMIFRDTSIIFKDNKLSFDLDPRRMEMPGLLKMLTDATTTMSVVGGGTGPDGEKVEVFKVGVVKVGEIPAGVRASLDLPPITIGGGTTAMSNLSFGGHFELLALDKNLKFKFLLGLGFYLGKREAPFNLTIFILGGGGFIHCDLTFEPKTGLSVDFVLSLHASVGLAISAGFMTGSVLIMIGFEGEYHKRPESGASVYVTIYLRIIGNVNLLSIATIYLGIFLEATYMFEDGGNRLVGKGEVRAELRICRFVKIKVRKAYQKKLAGSGSSRSGSSPAALLFDAVSQRSINNQGETVTQRAENILHSLA
jgi:hypothetical protein